MESFESTYKTHYSKLYQLARRIINNENVACDIIQDVFVRYFEKMEQGYLFRDTPAWLTRVTMNKSFDYLKQMKMHVQLDTFDLLEISADVDTDEMYVEPLKLRKAVSCLKPKEIKLVLLYSEGYSYKEIAEMADINFTSVGKSLSRAIGKIKENLRQMNDEMY